MPQAKVHHFIPVGHVARFSGDVAGTPRNKRVAVYDKVARELRGPTKTGNVARESGLYGIRQPEPGRRFSDPDELVQSMFADDAKDEGFEILE